VISPPRRGDLYPGRVPPVRVQWMRLPLAARAASVGVPLALAGLVFGIDVRAGATVIVLVAGMGLASGVYVKNRTDRHNAAVDRGEIRAIPDPHFVAVDPAERPGDLFERLSTLPSALQAPGKVVRFDGGWIARPSNPSDVAVLLGDDGGWARFDPRTVTDLWAVGEYLAGRGRDG
jgi:hypothetical protein